MVKQAGASALLTVKVGLRRGHVRLQLPTTVFVVEVQVGSTVDWCALQVAMWSLGPRRLNLHGTGNLG